MKHTLVANDLTVFTIRNKITLPNSGVDVKKAFICFLSACAVFGFGGGIFAQTGAVKDQKSAGAEILSSVVQNYLQAQNPSASVNPAATGQAPAVNPLSSYVSPEQGALNAILQTKHQAAEAVKSAGGVFQQYFTDKNIQMKHRQMLDQFDAAFYSMIRGFPLASDERQILKTRVEKTYIDDVASGRNQLDQQAFRDLGFVIRKEYSEMMLAKATNEMVDVYDLKGRVKTRWNIINGLPHGHVVTYYEDGGILYVDTYDQGQKTGRKKYNPEGKLEFDEDYRTAFQPRAAVAQPKAVEAVSASPAVQPKAVAAAPEAKKETNECCPCNP